MDGYHLFSLNPSETIEHLQHYYFPPYVTLAHLFNAPQGWHIKSQYLKQYQIQYVLEGTAEYEIEGRVYTTRKGDMIVHRPQERHAVSMLEGEPYVCISVVFHFGSACFPFDDLFGQSHAVGNFSSHPVEAMLGDLVTHYHQPGLAHQMHCQSLLLQILAEAAKWRNEQDTLTDVQQKNMGKLILIKNYIMNNYAKEIQHEDLERISGFSRNYIIKLFKKEFGMSPMQYLTWIRIQKAKQYAVHTTLSIGEIAGLVGYSDVHTFGKMFKKKTGSSLSQFCSTLYITNPD